VSGAVVAAAVLVAAGSSAATADTTPHGIVHFAGFTDNDGAGESVILTGALGDFGTAVSINPDGSVSADHAGQQSLVLSQGGFRIDFAALDHKLIAALQTHPVNPHSCAGHVTVSGTAPVVPGSGSGAYQGLSGAFQLTVTLDELVPRTQCDWTGAMLKQSIMVNGSGDLSLSGH
jgi:hypothetical protein